MILIFIEAALRSLLVGLAIAAGLRIFRVRNVLAQKAAWELVLVSALIMPLLLPVTEHWHLLPAAVKIALPAHLMTLLGQPQTDLQARSGSAGELAPPDAFILQSGSPKIQKSSAPEQTSASRPKETRFHITHTLRAATPRQNVSFISGRAASSSAQPIAYGTSRIQEAQSPAPFRYIPISPIALALTLYCGIAVLFLVRLALGLFATVRLWHTATPVPANRVPHDAASLQLRASSKIASPLTVGSAILLPRDYINWDGEKLRIVLAHERSHVHQGDFYLQLLASLYTALVWFSPLGWWLKYELAELAEAISDRAGMEKAASRTSYAQILLEFAAAPRRVSIGVAMARPGSLSRRIERLLNDNSFRQCFAGGRRALVVVTLVPLALFASTTLVQVQAATNAQSPAPAPRALAAPALKAKPPLQSLQAVPATQAIPLRAETLAQLPVTPAALTVLPELKAPASAPVPELVAAASPAPAIPKEPAVTMAEGGMQEGEPLSFDRTLSVSGTVQLAVGTGSGNIHITRGPGNQIHVHGQIHVNPDGSEEQGRQIAANPPIEQSGDMIRVGQHQEQWRHITIDYQIEAPAGTLLAANSGSGDIVDEGVGRNAKLETGSGDIHATSLEGPFVVKTGSGNIVAEQTGQGDVVAQTGSGDIEIKDIHGSFRGLTGSGDIKASGTPSAPWALQTGSGNIELWTGNAPLTLDASTGSGSVTTEHGMMVQGTFDHHHIRGTLNGGGPIIRAQTGSGDIQIH